MRVGIYTGRHLRGDASWVLSRSFVLAMLDALRGENSTEVVVYVHPVTLDKRLQEGIELSPVLVTFATNYLYNGASRYFRKLPNGAQCRMLFRFLPNASPRFFDSLLLGTLAWRDELDVLHVIGETGLPWVTCPTVITLPPAINLIESTSPSDSNKSPLPRQKPLRSLKRANHVICNSEPERSRLVRQFGFNASAVTSSLPALDEAFLKAQETSLKTTQTLLLDNRGIKPGFLLISLPPGDNSAIDAATELINLLHCCEKNGSWSKDSASFSVVVLSDDERQEKRFRKKNSEIPLVSIPRRIHRAIILAHARAVLLLHLGPDRYRGILEALAVGVPVICAKDEMKFLPAEEFSGPRPSVIEIDVRSAQMVSTRLRELWAQETVTERDREGAAADVSPSLRKHRARTLRGTSQVVAEARTIYRKICLQAGQSRK